MNAFSASCRVVLCDRCLSPVRAAPSGGQVPCPRCSTVNSIPPRDDRTPLVPEGGVTLSEPERLARLRMQDGKPLILPPAIQPLFQGLVIAPGKQQEAMNVWNQLRQQLRVTKSFEHSESLTHLAVALGLAFFDAQDELRRRAIFESSLDLVTLPRHRQWLRALLARGAARKGDVASAEIWLAPCDRQSEDLDVDTEWRLSRAYIDTLRGDWNAVLSVLGRSGDKIPIRDVMDAMATVLRANALEQLGELDAAVQLLMAEMAKGAASRMSVRTVIERHPQLRLCPAGFAAAESKYSQAAARVVASFGGGSAGAAFYFFGIALLVGAAAFGALSLFKSEKFLLIPAAPLLIAGLITFTTGRSLYRNTRQARWLRIHGVPAAATVLGLERTGTLINHVPLMRIRLRVHIQGRSPYETEIKMLVTEQLLLQLHPGSTVAVRVHPSRPQDAVIEVA